MRDFIFRFGLPLLSIAVLVGTVWLTSRQIILPYGEEKSLIESDIVGYLSDDPLSVAPTPILVPLSITRESLMAFAEIVAARGVSEAEQSTRSRIQHASRLSSLLHSNNFGWLVRDEARRIVEVQLPENPFKLSWHGLEVVENSNGERTEHRDQLLASLAEAGVPLSCRIKSADGVCTVRDLLRTSLKEFHLNQEEISWTTLAFSFYLPPQASWKNRYLEEFTFDQLADALLDRSLASESCGGIHLVFAMTQLLLVDREISILTPRNRARLNTHIAKRVRQAVESQLADGSWPQRWSADGFHGKKGERFTSAPTLSLRITVAGHLLEWFHFLPAPLKPPEETVKAGLLWLWSQLRSASREQISVDFCPFSHAIRALDLAIPK